MPTLSPAQWDVVARHWRLGAYSVEALSRKYGVDQSTIHYHARTKKWPPRGSARGDTELTYRTFADDWVQDLAASVADLRASDTAEDSATARDRLTRITLYQRSIATLRAFEAEKRAKAPPPKPEPVLFTRADEDALIRRIERLVAEDAAAQTPPVPKAAP